MIDHLVLTMPLKTVSEANQRGHWSVRHKRKVAQQQEVLYEWHSAVGGKMVKLPCRVTLTRYGPKLLDTDNLAGAFKYCRDMLAALLNVDDDPGSPVQWVYRQEKLSKREHRIKIEVESL